MTTRIIKKLLSGQLGNVYVCSIANDRRVDNAEQHVAERDEAKLAKFAKVRDVEGRGTFFCVSTMKRSRRNKESAIESHFLFADIDFKTVNGTKDEILVALQTLEVPPSLIVFTGNGFHVYWFLDRPSLPEDQAAFENALRRVAWVVAGDPMVCHVAALLRMPGTHNSKRGQWTEVEEVGGSGNDYSLPTLTAWLSSITTPAITYRPRERDSNPFLAAAADMGFRPPMDAAQALADMQSGGGEYGIHSTQLRVAASLMSSGVSVDEAVAQIMDATRPHADATWDMVAEEKAVRKMCTDWLRKHPRETENDEPPRTARTRRTARATSAQDFREDEGGGAVVSLSQAREHRDDPDDEPDGAASAERPKKLKKGNEHSVLAPGILAAMAERGEHMLYTEGRMYLYRGGLWAMQSSDEEKCFVDYQVELGCRALNITANVRIANETKAALRRDPSIHRMHVPWDSHGKVPATNGLIHPRTLEIEDLKPEHYATTVMDVLHDPEAICPNWDKFLEELIPDQNIRDFLQECVGMAMVKTKPRALTRALILQGPSFSGKSNVLNIISALIDKEVNSTALEMLENSHGLVNFLKPSPWVLHEAFEQSRWEMSANVKALLSGDPITINVKNGPLVSHRYRGAVLWATNVPPQFKESSRAIETRIAVVKFKKVFDPATVTGMAKVARDGGYSSISEMILDTERSGLLNWALKGMVRAQERGHFVFTNEMVRELEEVRNVSNVAVGFFADCVEFDAGCMVKVTDIHAAFTAWWEENHGGNTPTPQSFGRAVSAMADPRIMQGVKYSNAKIVLGMRLSEEGMDFWTARSNSATMERSTLRISDRPDDVNVSPLPQSIRERRDVLDWVEELLGEDAADSVLRSGTAATPSAGG